MDNFITSDMKEKSPLTTEQADKLTTVLIRKFAHYSDSELIVLFNNTLKHIMSRIG
jgi:hypothetical protein